ncbi:MAG: HlyC/CorC family transporter [Pseudorhodoplanes sp.]
MSGSEWLSVAVIICGLLLSAFFSASETALTAASRARMARLEKQGNGRARIVNWLLDTRERMIGALLVGNNLANIVASTLTTGILLTWFGDVGVLYATIVMSVIVIVFAEVLPKSAAINAPERIALAVARPMRWVVIGLGPLLFAIEIFVRRIMRVFGVHLGAGQPILSAHEELRGAVEFLHAEGGVEKQDRDMFGGLLDLRELEVSDVMRHRTSMVTLNADDPPAQIVRAALEAPVTRLPLWRGSVDNIVGVLHAKDLLRAIQAVGGDLDKLDVSAIASAPWFVPDTTPLAEQLRAFRRRKTPFAIVVDEYGVVMGLVTLEDILEEIVGDISDERDVVVPGVRPQLDGSVNVDGAVPIRDLNRAMDWNLPDEEATTIAGLVIHESRSIPEPGQGFTFYGFRFRVLRRNRNRITALRITPLVRKPVKLR